jgi:toxin ParE1/3/4
MTRVVWSKRSLRNINAIRAYVGQFNPLASQRLAIRLRNAGESLRDFPERGVLLSGDRRQLTSVPPYLIRYSYSGGIVSILEIRHAAENAP